MAKLKDKVKSSLKHAWRVLKKLIPVKLMVILGMYAGWLLLNSDQLQRYYLRYTVGTKVVKMVLLDDSGRVLGGGTGFAVKAPSGETYIMTNSHVCAIAKNEEINIQLKSGEIMPRHIVKDSDYSDLCLVEGIPGMEGISLADNYDMGEMVSIVGHPRLFPLTVSKGEIIGKKREQILLGEIGAEIPAEKCTKPKHKIVEDIGFGGVVNYCLEDVVALQTTAVGLPGNSGSPVVNAYGHLVGVLFAGDNETHWSFIIPLEEVKKMLAAY